ncbi:uncharacterized protein LOC129600792 [Paramacrobiotus metropolitanus]|uniref:uncharacterized protein LOC129600792 n=1 Tax=Paramacrobiotus metropolitanus TaxID=2943436 RepID=UPI002445EA6B|nr:uncharacterized protein LOC129600792 [Paramacrobiotus metropolitanus]
MAALLTDGEWNDDPVELDAETLNAAALLAAEDDWVFEDPVPQWGDVDVSDVPETIVSILEYILFVVLNGVKDTDRVRLRIDSRHFNRPLYTSLTLRSELSVKRWMTDIQRVLNSHEEFVIDDSFQITAQHTQLPSGRCVKDVPVLLKRRLMKMQSVVIVNGDDDLCMARALVMGKALADKNSKRFRSLRKGKREITKLAKLLILRAGLPERSFGLSDIPAFEKVLKGYRIIVVSIDHANAIVHKGQKHKKHIILLHHDGHFDLLKSLPAFFKRSYWCFDCMKGYSSRVKHRCKGKCALCLRVDCPEDTANFITCLDCNRQFPGQNCFDHHKLGSGKGRHKKRIALCDTVKVCVQCRCIYSNAQRKPDNPHRCGETKCKVCSIFDLPSEHRCYMRPKPFTSDRKARCSSAQFLYFDFETYVSASGELVPNLAVVQDSNGEEWTFPDSTTPIGGDVTNDLCEFLFQEDHKGFYVIAHNFKGFDGYFILNWLLRNGIVPKVIMNGGKLLMLDVPAPYDIHFRDSYSYNPQSLSKWPATFGLEDTSKGTFPHRFNREENWNKIVPFPSKDEYGYTSMKQKDRIAFDHWYEAEVVDKNGLFDFRREFEGYCRNDVTVLRKCCQQFCQLFMDISDGLNPFVSALTIAGVCSNYWRTFLLQPEQIGLIPNHAYNRNRPQSSKALRWLQWTEAESMCTLQTKLSGAEYKIGTYFVDGYCAETKTVYEFHGCWFHGCPQCVAADTVHPYRGMKMSDIYKETLDRDQYFRDLGFQVVVMWEHEYDKLVADEPEFNEFIRMVKIRAGINPRDAFYGGRTNATRLHYKINGNERICYYDVCSEYPFVNKTKRYPTSHPRISICQYYRTAAKTN